MAKTLESAKSDIEQKIKSKEAEIAKLREDLDQLNNEQVQVGWNLALTHMDSGGGGTGTKLGPRPKTDCPDCGEKVKEGMTMRLHRINEHDRDGDWLKDHLYEKYQA